MIRHRVREGTNEQEGGSMRKLAKLFAVLAVSAHRSGLRRRR